MLNIVSQTQKKIFNFIETLGLLFLIALCLYTRWVNMRVPGDDAFMTFKLAMNFGKSFDFFYNKNEYVYGTTPLYTVLVGLIFRALHLDPVVVSRYLNTFLDILNVALFYKVVQHAGLNRFFSFLASYVFLMSWANINSSTLGMETPLFLHVFLLVTYVYQKDIFAFQQPTLGILLGFLTLVRPEGAFLFLSLLGCEKVILRKKVHQIFFGYLFIFGSWLTYSYFKFGYLFPPSIASKSLAYFRYPFSALMNLLLYPQKVFLIYEVGDDIKLISVIATGVVLIISFYYFLANKKKNYIFLGFYLIFFLTYSYKNPFIFPWYLVPLEICVISSVCYLVQILSTASTFRFINFGRGFGAISVLWFILYPILQLSNPITCTDLECGKFLEIAKSITPEVKDSLFVRWDLATSEREEQYIKLAKEFSQEISSSAVVLAPEFGAFGYYSEARIISSIGHISPEIFSFLPVPKEILVINSAIPIDMVRSIKPDYLLSLEIFIRKSLLVDQWFQDNYEVLKFENSRALTSNGLYLFQKKN